MYKCFKHRVCCSPYMDEEQKVFEALYVFLILFSACVKVFTIRIHGDMMDIKL